MNLKRNCETPEKDQNQTVFFTRFKDYLKHLLVHIKHNKDNEGANLDHIKDLLYPAVMLWHILTTELSFKGHVTFLKPNERAGRANERHRA